MADADAYHALQTTHAQPEDFRDDVESSEVVVCVSHLHHPPTRMNARQTFHRKMETARGAETQPMRLSNL